MPICLKCGEGSPTNTSFCTQCGTAFAPTTATPISNRPLISMDPSKQDQTFKKPSEFVPQTSQIQPSSLLVPANKQGTSKNKIAFGAIGVLVAIVALVLIIQPSDSGSPDIAPSSQQSESNYAPTTDAPVETTSYDNDPSYGYYASDDDWSYVFRSDFVGACDDGSSYEYCVCVLEALEVQFYEWEVEELYANDPDLTFATSAVMSCL
jgi:hypothetical protein